MERQDVYIFNPENDLALAHGGDNYTAPPQACALRHNLQLLPAWLAPSGSRVVVDGNLTAANRWLTGHGLGVKAIGVDDIAALGPCHYHPWGWRRAMRRTLEKWGARKEDLPTDSQLEAVRCLSHRRTTIAMHHAIASQLGVAPCPVPVELDSMDGVREFVARHPGCYLKIPLSGSGRGVYRVLNGAEDDPYLWPWAEGALRRQGSLLAEVGLHRTMDMAMEFECGNDGVTVMGYSVFENDAHNQYARCLVDSNLHLRAHIGQQFPDFGRMEQAVTQAVAQLIAPHYRGPLGIDMLLYLRGDGTTGINPCVEVNVRHTMGMVAVALGERHGKRGWFSFTPKNTHTSKETTTFTI